MKRRITLSIALVLSVVLVSLTSSDSTVKAQNQITIVADTGFVPLGPGQILRLTVLNARESGSGQATGFRRIEYTQGVCNGGVCKHAISSQITSPPIMLGSGEAVSFDITPMPNSSGVRGVVVSNSQGVKVNALVIDGATSNIIAVLVAL